MPDATAMIYDLPLSGSTTNAAIEATQGGSAVKVPLTLTTIRAESWIIRRDLTSPPANPAEGDRYLVAASATGDWMGLDGRIVQWVLDGRGNGNWYNKLPAGILYVLHDDAIIYYNGTAWVDISSLFSADFDAAGAAAAVLATSAQKSQNLADLSDKPTALANLGGAKAGANSDISFLQGLARTTAGAVPTSSLQLVDPATGIVYALDPISLDWLPTHGSLAAAPSASTLDTACASAGIPWHLDAPLALTAGKTFSALVLGMGGVIDLAGFTLDFAGGFDAPSVLKCFDVSGGGAITFSGGIAAVSAAWPGLTINDNSSGVCASNAASIQAMVDAANVSATAQPSGCRVNFPAGYIYSDALTQKSCARWKGAGKNATILRPNPSLTGKFVKTLNFDTLTGQNKWLVSDGVQYGFGFDDMMIDGTGLSGTCSGLAIYGKGYFIGDDFSVQNFTDQNIYSECGYVGGQTDYRDMPEGCISFDVRGSTNEGLVFRGPHDAIVRRVVQADCGITGGKKGVVFETDGSTYNGSCNIGSIHSYTTGDDAIYINCFVTADLLVGETTPKHAIEFGPNAAGSLIGKVEVFAFDSGGMGNYSGVYDGGGVTIKELWGRKQFTCHSVVNQAVSGSRVGGAVIRNLGTGTGRGVYMGASNTRFEGSINGLNQAGDVGLELASGLSGLRTDADIQNCTTHLKIGATPPQRSVIDITGFINPGQTFYSGPVGPGTDNHWRVTSTDGTTRQRSKYSAKSSDAVALDSTGVKDVTFTHNLFLTPSDYQCRIIPISGSVAGNDAVYTWRIQSVSATQVVVRFYVNTASATSGAKLSVAINIDLSGD